MVSAHCDMCEKCQRFVEIETESLAAQMVSNASLSAGERTEMALQFGDMLSQITQLPSSRQSGSAAKQPLEYREPLKQKASSQVNSGVKAIELDGRVFTLPRTLHRYIDKTGN